MLVLTRFEQERVRLLLPDGMEIWVRVVEIRNSKVRLGFDAPNGVVIEREEIIPKQAPK